MELSQEVYTQAKAYLQHIHIYNKNSLFRSKIMENYI